MRPYKSRDSPCEYYYLVEKFMKKAQKQLRNRRAIENRMKILEIIGENRLEFVEKCKINKISGMISIGQ